MDIALWGDLKFFLRNRVSALFPPKNFLGFTMTKNLVYEIQNLGWTKITSAFDSRYIDFAKESIEKSKKIYARAQLKAGLQKETVGTTHHLPFLFPELVKATFNDDVWSFLGNYFEGKFILGSFGSTTLVPKGSTYTQKMHRDARDSYSARDMLNLIILLDDSDVCNGATKMLEKSHLDDRRPSDLEFARDAISISGSAGDMIAFNPYAWHSTGQNNTKNPRTIITPMVTRPFLKPSADYIRGIGEEQVRKMNHRMRQILGYYARTPASLSEFYQPKHKRYYRADQV